MGKYFVIMSFYLHEGQLENWKKLSKEIDADISKAKGFISRDSGIDADNRVYCLVKWESVEDKVAFRNELESREGWDKMMEHFGSIANMETATIQEISLF